MTWHIIVIYLSFICLSGFFRTYGLRRFMFLDKLRGDSRRVQVGYAAKINKSFRIMVYFLAPLFIAECGYKALWFYAGGRKIPFLGNPVASDIIACILELASWIYRLATFLHMSCNCYSMCKVWLAMHYLHGCSRYGKTSAQRFQMRLLGAEVRAVHSGTATLKDATSQAIRDWVTNVETTHYILGSVAGPHPYPMMVREFHAVIGKETRRQAMEKWGGKPDVLVACVGGGSNAMGLFHEFVDDADVRLIGVEAAGHGLDSGKHAATLTKGEVGVLHGAMSYLLQDDDGQIIEPHSISAGLDYPGVGPEHSFLKDIGRAEYYSITDDEALEAFKRLSRLEGIIPALETSHALAYLEMLCPTLPDGTKVVLNCSGRGDKDVQTAIKYLQM